MAVAQRPVRQSTRANHFDLVGVPWVGRVLRWRHIRTAFQIPVLAATALLLVDGWFGDQLAPKNLAGVLPWVQWRGVLILGLLVLGNVFCFACPFMLPRRLAKRWLPASSHFPRWLRGKWLAAAMLALFFWAYEAFNLWASPWLTAWVILAYFVAAFAIDGLFKGAAFCKYVCPIGQFNFVNAMVSPFEVGVRDAERCTRCTTKDCISPYGAVSGCELWLFQQTKRGNLDCTFCLDCLHACPHDNVGILTRSPLQELWDDERRSSLGVLSQRTDIAALIAVLVFAAYVNVFGMVSPVYPLESRIAQLIGSDTKPPVILVLFAIVLAAWFAALGITGLASRALLSGTRTSLSGVVTAYSFALVPLGFGVWLAHYAGFHFLSGALSIVPVVQNLAGEFAGPLLGPPRWLLGPIVPTAWLVPIEIAFLEIGWLGSVLVAVRIGDRLGARLSSLPWVLLSTVLVGAGIWLFLQPMEMRGTFLGGG